MERIVTTDLGCAAEQLYPVVVDLGTYPAWMGLVHRAVPAPARPGDEGPAWSITLRAKIGPFARSKRLRMVRVEAIEPNRVRFERREDDGRDHSSWTLIIDLDRQATPSTRVRATLRYGGRFWSPPLDAVLGRQIDDALARLEQVPYWSGLRDPGDHPA